MVIHKIPHSKTFTLHVFHLQLFAINCRTELLYEVEKEFIRGEHVEKEKGIKVEKEKGIKV